MNTESGSIWVIGWLFTIAFNRLRFVEALVALFIWPWYLGKKLSN